MPFLKVFNVGDNFDSRLRQFFVIILQIENFDNIR